METSYPANCVPVPDQHVRRSQQWVPLYTSSIAITGLLISLYAFFHLPADRVGMVMFVIMAVVVELASVELFQNSRSYVSLSSIIAIASIAALGPEAGVVSYLASGLTTALKTSLEENNSYEQRASLLRRTSFNAGMWVVAAFLAGQAFTLAGGVSGRVGHLPDIAALTAATAVEWLMNAAILVGVISLQTGQRTLDIWNRDLRWQAPLSIVGGVLGGGILAIAYKMFGIPGVLTVLFPILASSYAFRLYKDNMKGYVDGLETLNGELKEALVALERSNTELLEVNNAVRRLNDQLFQSLAKVFDMRDPYVGGHAAQVAVYAVEIATEMGLPAERIELIRQAAYLHDIGKLSIPEAILHKPGNLTEIEYEFIKKHADFGADMLASTEGLKHLASFVRYHHERWDGAGYPVGLVGDEIPLEARILNVCDSVETMASDRPYHRGMSKEAILAEVQRCSGTQFDPVVAETFINLVRKKGADLFIVNSARSVTQQYAASILASESLTQSIFAWVLEKDAQETSRTHLKPAAAPRIEEVVAK